MPASPAFFKKPPTAPRAALQSVAPIPPCNVTDHAASLDHVVKWNEAGIIVVVLYYPAFASALVRYISSAKSIPFPCPADHARYLGFLNLVSTFWFDHQFSF